MLPDAPRSWLFRVASRPEDGAGHLSRCRALAKALAAHDGVVFLLDDGGEFWMPLLESEGLRATTAGQDLRGPWAGSVLDGYHFTRDTADELGVGASPVVAIDDFLSPPPGVHLVINATLGLEGETVKGIPALLGPRYALLDEQFMGLDVPAVSPTVGHVLLTFGATDPLNATGLAMDALQLLEPAGFRPRVTVVMPSRSVHRDALGAKIAARLGVVEATHEIRDMARLLRSADLVIGGGGVSLLERLASAVPSVTLCLADNQRAYVGGAVRAGATADGGMLPQVSAADLAEGILLLANDPQRRQDMAEAGHRLVDGRGAERVAGVLRGLAERHAMAAGSR